MSEVLPNNAGLQVNLDAGQLHRLKTGTIIERKAMLNSLSKEFGIPIEELLKLISRREVEKVYQREPKQLLFHYHTIPTARLIFAQEQGALKSMEIQENEGRVFTSKGTRPDVVQFTRDKYDDEGALLESGIGEAMNVTDDMSILVFDPKIMDLPDYDITGGYPAIPSIRIGDGIIKACLNNYPERVAPLLAHLSMNNPNMEIMTTEAWRDSNQPSF